MNREHKYYKSTLLFLLILIIATSCVGSRVLKLDQSLYLGAEVKLHSDTTIEGKKKLAGQLNDQLYPLPNSTILGIPVKLMIYSRFGRNGKSKGLGRYIGDNYVEKPVIIADVPIDEVSGSVQTILKANGYLDATVEAEKKNLKFRKKSKKIIYHCYLHAPYHLKNITIAIADTDVSNLISLQSKKSLIHPGDQYNLVNLKEERERLNLIFKNNGYFYFSPDHLIYLADSSIGSRQINLTMTLRKGVDSTFFNPWFVNDVLLKDLSLGDSVSGDTVNYKRVNFLTSKQFSPKLLKPLLLLNPGDLLTYDRYSITNKNISSLSAFKYTNIETIPDSLHVNHLSVLISVTPNKRKHFSAEANMVSKSNHFAGPGIVLSQLNRNLFGGGEDFLIKISGNVEAWLSKDSSQTVGNFNYELRSSAELNVPRFWMIKRSIFSPRFIPYTHLKADARYINQMQFYRMSFFRLSYGYHWNETSSKHHELNLADVTFQHRLRSTHYFDSLVNINTLLQQSFADQFIVGTNYSYQYSLPRTDPRTLKTALAFSIETAGNIINAVEHLAGRRKTGDEPLHFLGAAYAQYIRTSIDYRVYLKLTRSDELALRINTGIGIPYGNSRTLPNIKQFFLGGANSLRAFRFRSIGPGAYATDNTGDAIFVNHTGDLQLQASIENRLKVSKHFELALFIDAGNIWLMSNDPLRPNGQFKKETFYKQLAVGWGYGVRYLNEFFIIRLDVGVPLYSPNPMEKVSVLKPILNFAFGYPF